MKKKLFASLLPSVLICFAFVFTNASSNSFSVSGRVNMVIDYQDTIQGQPGVNIQVIDYSGNILHEYLTGSTGRFYIPNVNNKHIIRYWYFDEYGSTEIVERQYSKETRDEIILLHYLSNH